MKQASHTLSGMIASPMTSQDILVIALKERKGSRARWFQKKKAGKNSRKRGVQKVRKKEGKEKENTLLTDECNDSRTYMFQCYRRCGCKTQLGSVGGGVTIATPPHSLPHTALPPHGRPPGGTIRVCVCVEGGVRFFWPKIEKKIEIFREKKSRKKIDLLHRNPIFDPLKKRKRQKSIFSAKKTIGATFFASNLGFATCQDGLSNKFWDDLKQAWSIVREKLHLNTTGEHGKRPTESADGTDARSGQVAFGVHSSGGGGRCGIAVRRADVSFFQNFFHL